jgi:hypothetical protein
MSDIHLHASQLTINFGVLIEQWVQPLTANQAAGFSPRGFGTFTGVMHRAPATNSARRSMCRAYLVDEGE